MMPIEWDESQRQVIDAPPDDRLLVGAGPGTGKTAVACARVARLIDRDGLEPSRIWLISFTRTAVREIRDRIADYLEDRTAAFAVKIATLDSHAWAIHSGFDDDAGMLASYDENIERVLDLVRRHENVAEYVNEVEHLIVDEAQDMVGVRADLLIAILRNLSCGATVFLDEAQAIYGFADDKEVTAGEIREPSLSEKIRRSDAGTFRSCELTVVHRTKSVQLREIFSETRQRVLAAADEGEDRLGRIMDEVTNLADGKAPSDKDPTLRALENALILYRRRFDVLLRSSFLTAEGIPHRVRMSGLPLSLAPWIGAALSEYTEVHLSRDRFMELWTDNVNGTPIATCTVEDAWEHLVRIAGRTPHLVDMRDLRRCLGRKQPPADLCHAELGLHGPVVSTIHASKGREADTVHLMLPFLYGQGVDREEEARVVFVGATRARLRLQVGRGYRSFAKRVEDTGRTYRVLTEKGHAYAQVEVGRDTDIRAEGLAGRRFFASPDAVRASQKRIRGFAAAGASLVADSDRGMEFAYRLTEGEHGRCLTVLSQSVNSDLFTVANEVQASLGGGKRRPPDRIPHLSVRGVRTIVLPRQSPEGESLHEPWSISGIVLAPLILGYSRVFFPRAG